MTPTLRSLTDASDEQLLAEVTRLAAHERQATAALIHALMELDARRLYLAQGCASLYAYCTRVLHLSEHAALGRIEAARCARRLPRVLDLLVDGSTTITNVRLLAPLLTQENHHGMLGEARHKSKREVEEIVARLRPLPDVAPSIRRLPQSRAVKNPDVFATPGASPPLPARPLISPIAQGRHKVQFTISDETRNTLRHAQDLLRHVIPNGEDAGRTTPTRRTCSSARAFSERLRLCGAHSFRNELQSRSALAEEARSTSGISGEECQSSTDRAHLGG